MGSAANLSHYACSFELTTTVLVRVPTIKGRTTPWSHHCWWITIGLSRFTTAVTGRAGFVTPDEFIHLAFRRYDYFVGHEVRDVRDCAEVMVMGGSQTMQA